MGQGDNHEDTGVDHWNRDGAHSRERLNGLHAGGSFAASPTSTALIADYVTAMLKGDSGNNFVLKGSNAQSGSLKTMYDGARPVGYSPQKKEGATILGTGGDNSHAGEGTFFEGCMTSGFPSGATDDAVQADIVAAGTGADLVRPSTLPRISTTLGE